MTTSGTVTFSVSRDQILSLALQSVGVMALTDTTSSTSFTDNSTTVALWLNMLVKQWSGRSDFAPGLKMWSRKLGYLFLQTATSDFTLGPTTTDTGTTNKFASAYTYTTLSANAALAAGTITVASITGLSSTDRIGIKLTSGAIQWTTINGAPSGSTVTLTNTLTGAAASGNSVYSYPTANQSRMPIEILSVDFRDTSNNDVFMTKMLLSEYEAIPSKTTAGTPSRYYFKNTLVDGTISLDYQPSDVDHVLRIVYLSPIEDFNAAADTPDYPQAWYLPLAFGTAYVIAPSFGRQDLMPSLKALRDEALAIAKNAIPETTKLYYQPEMPT